MCSSAGNGGGATFAAGEKSAPEMPLRVRPAGRSRASERPVTKWNRRCERPCRNSQLASGSTSLQTGFYLIPGFQATQRLD